jgi:hypothetical protein
MNLTEEENVKKWRLKYSKKQTETTKKEKTNKQNEDDKKRNPRLMDLRKS